MYLKSNVIIEKIVMKYQIENLNITKIGYFCLNNTLPMHLYVETSNVLIGHVACFRSERCTIWLH